MFGFVRWVFRWVGGFVRGVFRCACGFVRVVFRWAGWLVRGVFRWAGGFVRGVFRCACGFVRGSLHGWVGLCEWVIRIKNDNRYERVQKIDPRNTLRGMKTKETIFLK